MRLAESETINGGSVIEFHYPTRDIMNDHFFSINKLTNEYKGLHATVIFSPLILYAIFTVLKIERENVFHKYVKKL